VIITNHKSYDYAAILAKANFVFDTRNAMANVLDDTGKVQRL